MIKSIYSATEQGGRQYQEDKYVNEEINKSGKPIAYFAGIFDGHGGASISTLAQANFPKIIEQGIKDLNQMEIGSIVKNSFYIIDNLALHNNTPSEGCTVAYVLVTANTIWFANAGDSMTIVGMDDESFKVMSQEHKVEFEEERIVKDGGLVINVHGMMRLFGNLNLSRSVGDHEYKKWVICQPYIRSMSGNLKNQVKFIFIASDGIWDVLDFDYVNRYLQALDPNLIEFGLKVLIKKAMTKGSTDNITCTYITLNK